MSRRPLVVFGLYGPVLDRGEGPRRWDHWRPSVSLFQHDDFLVDRFEFFVEPKFRDNAARLMDDIRSVSPETAINLRAIEFADPWDFEGVFAVLHDFAQAYPFSLEEEDYIVHITTGSHVQQICLFLLTESRHFPARLIQTAPPERKTSGESGRYSVIDLDLSRYDRIADRFAAEASNAVHFLKSGIATLNDAFNQQMTRIEQVAVKSRAPILLTGPTGAGKSLLARRIYELKRARHQLSGSFIAVNCATLRGDGAMSALFGHTKGAFTGAASSRQGHLRSADGGLLFLDEVGELGRDEQATLLHAIEEKQFFPVGSDQEVTSDFQLIAGTNKDLHEEVHEGRFREDLLARMNLWTFRLPPLRERPEDIEPNLDYELNQFAEHHGTRITINREARNRFLQFARSPGALWSGNFRDLNAAVYRMATLAEGTRIDTELVEEEVGRLGASWRSSNQGPQPKTVLEEVLSSEQRSELDLFDRVQLDHVLGICRQSQSLSEAGRALFAVSRLQKKGSNDTDRLRKYLLKFSITWSDIHPKTNTTLKRHGTETD